MPKFVLIDAHSIIFRSFFAFIKNPLRTSKGQNTSGVFGFLNTLEKIKKRIPTDYIGLAFDAPGETFRDVVYKEYKATRPPAPADLPFQVETVKTLCAHLGIPSFELQGYEADDILATFSQQLKHTGEVYIVTSDKDLLQLVHNNIFIYDAYGDIVYDRERVLQKLGVPPERVVEYLALTGDASDNVPGVPGIGPKRAREIMQAYPQFEDALAHDKRLVPHREKALFSRKLISLECHVPLQVAPHDLKVKKPDIQKLMPLLTELEFHSYIKTFAQDLPSSIVAKKIEKLPPHARSTSIGIAAENKEWYLCAEPGTVYNLPYSALHDVLCDQSITKIGYDVKNLLKMQEIKPPFIDVKVVSWLLDPNKKGYGLQDVALQYVQTFTHVTPVTTAHVVLQLYPVLMARLNEQNQKDLYHTIEEPLISVLAAMEQRGIRIDEPYFIKFSKEMEQDIQDLERAIYEIAGKTFNINSPRQLSEVLFTDLKLKPAKRGKTHFSTDVEVLQQLSASHPLPQKILAYRELAKIQSTYVAPLIITARENRIHTTFNQTGTATGRLSSSNPNLQNIPIRTEIGRKIRKGFIADENFVLVSADYSQVELRILAHITKDNNLIQAFQTKRDIHNHTASLIFSVPEQEITDKQRRMAKVVNYGLIYGMSDYGLAQGLDIPQEQALHFIQSYHDLYPEVEKWRTTAIRLAEERGYTETLFHRRRPLPDIHSRNHAIREFSKRAAINTPIQGTAADLIKLAMIEAEKRLSQAGFRSGLLLSIHDELLFEIEKERIDEAQEIIQESMVKVIDLAVPIELSIGIGENWDEAH